MERKQAQKPRMNVTTNLLSWLRATQAWLGTRTARTVLLVLFALQAVLLVFVTNVGTPPDENNHWQFINFYANHSLSPIFTDQQPTLNLGDKTREVDYLYHYVMSLVVRLLPFSDSVEQHIVRLFSVGFAVLSFVFLAKVLRKLKLSEALSTVTILLLSQLSMVLLMSSAINNDSLVWLGMILGLWLLLEIWERARVPHVLGVLLLVASGGLIKRTLLPIAAVIFLVMLALLWRQRQAFALELKKAARKPAPLVVVLVVLVAISGGLSVERIGGNVLRYGTVTPSCEQVQGEAACYNFWASVRARQLAARPPEPLIAPQAFVGRWVWESVKNVLDIQTQGWRHEVVPPVWLTPASLLLLGVGLLYGTVTDGRRYRQDPVSRKRLAVLALSLSYIAFHMLYNYSEYKDIRVFGLALNGRYILAGFFPLVGLTVFYWSRLLRRRPALRAILAVAVVVSLAAGSGLALLLRNPQLFHG